MLFRSTSYSSPKQVGALTNWLKVSAGAYHSVAVKSDGTLWAWGNNDYGQLGYASGGGNRSSPQQIGALTDWYKSACGEVFTLSVKTDGTLWSWGYNSSGQLGLGNGTSYSSPKQVGSLTTWSDVACGTDFSFGLKTDGTMWTWGANANGQLGDNTTVSKSSPVQAVTFGSNWVTAAAGLNFSAAIKNDGTLWLWGANTSGQLGDNTTVNKSSPVQAEIGRAHV